MYLIKRIYCYLNGHRWANDSHFPVRGFYNMPYPDSWCLICHKKGSKYLRLRNYNLESDIRGFKDAKKKAGFK